MTDLPAIALLILFASGDVEQIPYKTEWECIQRAYYLTDPERGRQAWCVITTPDKRMKLEKYPY